MTTSGSSHIRPSLLRATVLFMGASIFAYLLGVTLHEIGHFIANIILGVPEKGIVLHPFDLSYNIYGGDLSVALGTPLRRAFSGISGPFFNILVAVVVSLLLWRRRSPRLLPLILLGSISLMQEAGGMIIGIIDYPAVIGDWGEVIQAGVPSFAIGLLAVTLLVGGSVWVMLLLPLSGFGAKDSFWKKLILIATGIPALMIGAVIYLSLFGSQAVPTELVLSSRKIAVAISFVIMIPMALLQRPLFPFLDKLSHTEPAKVLWSDALISFSLCAAIFMSQVLFFN